MKLRAKASLSWVVVVMGDGDAEEDIRQEQRPGRKRRKEKKEAVKPVYKFLG